MSTTVVVRKNGNAAIGADTMTKLGYTRESAKYIANPSKIIQVGETYIASVGHASASMVIESYFSRLETPPKFDSPRAIFETARTLHVALKDDYFLNPTEDADDEFESSQSQYLIANVSGIFGLYALRSVQEYSRFYAFGTGAKFALGAMHAVYESGLSAVEIARAGLMAGAEFDDSTGEPLEIKTIELSQN